MTGLRTHCVTAQVWAEWPEQRMTSRLDLGLPLPPRGTQRPVVALRGKAASGSLMSDLPGGAVFHHEGGKSLGGQAPQGLDG